MVAILMLLGLISVWSLLAQGDTGTRGTEGLKVDGTQSNLDLINALLTMRESMEVELEEANEEYADCEFDSVAYPDVRYCEGQLDGFKRAVALLKITLPGP